MIGNKTNKEKKMRKYIHSLLAFAAIVSFASCSSEDNNIAENGDNTKVMTFTATQEDNAPATRTAISSTNNKAIVWESGDQISVLDGSNNNQFTLKSGEETNSAIFEGTAASATTYTAVYPYQSGATLSGKSVNNVTLKATQTATPGSFDKTTALMMAQGNSTNLAFKNAVGYVKVTPKFDCSKIELKAFNNSVVLAGTGTLSYNNGDPKLDLSSAPTKDYAITLEGTISSGKSYYIAVPPVTLKAGWTIKFKATDGTEYSRMGKKDITFTRNKVTDLGTFDNTNSVTYWYDPRGTKVTAEQEVDLGLKVTIGTKRYRVIFAKRNLTANGLATKESDFGDYFAWGFAEPNYKSYTRTVSESGVTVVVSEWKDDKPKGYEYDPSLSKTYGNYEDFVMADDPARKILGGDWQVPTGTIWGALQTAINAKTISSSNGNVDKDGIKGRKLAKSGDDGTYIFLPNAGLFTYKNYNYNNNFYYWTSTTGDGGAIECFEFNGNGKTYFNSTDRRWGMPIRAVRLVAE